MKLYFHNKFCCDAYVMLLGLFENLGTHRDTTERQENCI